MCSPQLAVAALMAVSKASEISAANQAAASEQQAAMDQQAIMNQQRAMEAEGVKAKAGQELTTKKRERMRELATAKVAGAESGVAGVSPLRALSNVFMQESFDAGTIVALEEVNLAQIGVQSQADYQRTKSIINAAENKKSTGLSAALQIGVAGVSGYASAGGFAGGTGASSGGGLFGSETAFTQGGMSGSVVTPGYFGGAAGTAQGASYVPTRMLNGVLVPR